MMLRPCVLDEAFTDSVDTPEPEQNSKKRTQDILFLDEVLANNTEQVSKDYQKKTFCMSIPSVTSCSTYIAFKKNPLQTRLSALSSISSVVIHFGTKNHTTKTPGKNILKTKHIWFYLTVKRGFVFLFFSPRSLFRRELKAPRR